MRAAATPSPRNVTRSLPVLLPPLLSLLSHASSPAPPPLQIAQLLADSAARKRLVDEAIEVLQEAGDPRVAAPAPAPAQLSVDVAAAGWTAGAGPMSCTTSVRISPRMSSNPYSSNNILMLQ